MSLIIATGSNIGDSKKNLELVLEKLEEKFELIKSSQIYTSKAVEYLDQPDFFNQVLEFKIPASEPEQVMLELLELEKELGRKRETPKGPRTIDIDIIFWNLLKFESRHLTLPHPRWIERSFIIKPLQELPFFQTVEKCFTIPTTFEIDAFPI